jgi:hypothetical protein
MNAVLSSVDVAGITRCWQYANGAPEDCKQNKSDIAKREGRARETETESRDLAGSIVEVLLCKHSYIKLN